MLRMFRRNPQRSAKIINVALIFSVVVYVDVFHRLREFASLTVEFVQISQHALNIVAFALVGVSLVDFAAGAWLFGYSLKLVKLKRSNSPVDMRIFSLFVVRSAFFHAPATYGLILGVLGIDWRIAIAFFAASTFVQILSFPTQARWRRYLDAVGM